MRFESLILPGYPAETAPRSPSGEGIRTRGIGARLIRGPPDLNLNLNSNSNRLHSRTLDIIFYVRSLLEVLTIFLGLSTRR